MSDTPYSLSQLYCYLTEGCNLACRHCWLAPGFDPDGSKYPVLAVEAFEQAVKEAIPLGLSTVKLTGGEPMLHPKFLDFLEIVRKNELGLNIETNGTLCTREIAGRIADASNTIGVSISIDGANAQTHDAVRGVPGAFHRAVRAVEMFAEIGLHPQIILALMRVNARQIKDVAHKAMDSGASSLKINVVQPTARGERIRRLADELNIGDIIEIGRYVEMELAPSMALQFFFDYPMAFRPLSRIAEGNGCYTCGVLNILGLIPGGHYALCGIGKHVPELVFGQSGNDGLKTLWATNSMLNLLREGLPKRLKGVCGRCLMNHYCLGSCIAQNYYIASNFWQPYWFCDEADRLGLFPESRCKQPNRRSA